MKNRVGIMPLSSLPLDYKIAVKNLYVFFDEESVPNKVTKRIVLINDKQNKGLVIDSLEQIGIIDISGRPDAGGNMLWYPREKIGLFRKLSIEYKLIETDSAIDPKIKKVISAICYAEANNPEGAISVSEILLIAKSYIERYPVLGGS